MERGKHCETFEGIPKTEIWYVLRKVLASAPFCRSETLRHFLCFVVDETLAGRGDKLTEYVIGIGAFGRPSSFDPRLDSRVRVEAHRLRTALAAYYQNHGKSDPVRIHFSPGVYAPRFEYMNALRSPPSETAV